jgi:hypothetical protein
VVKDFTNFGIAITPFSNSQATVLIANGFILNNGASGIDINPLSAGTFLDYTIDRTTVAVNGTSGNDAGILFNGGTGNFSGTISSVQGYRNYMGVNFIGSGITEFAVIRNSVLSENLISDLSNNDPQMSPVLIDSNYIPEIKNSSNIGSDGTNDIINVQGNALQNVSFYRQ